MFIKNNSIMVVAILWCMIAVAATQDAGVCESCSEGTMQGGQCVKQAPEACMKTMCEEGWTQSTNATKCYKIMNNNQTGLLYDDANLLCNNTQVQAKLVMPKTVAEIEELVAFRGTYDIWVGLKRPDAIAGVPIVAEDADSKNTSHFTWDDGTKDNLDITGDNKVWAQSNPYGDGACVAIATAGNHYGLNDNSCTEVVNNRTFAVICEKVPTLRTVTLEP